MEVHFTGRHYETPPELKDYVTKKLEKLNNLEDRMGEVRVILSAEGYRQIAEIKFHASGHDFVGRDESADMQASVDLVMEKLAEQLKRFKERRKERHRRRDAARGGSLAERLISRRETVETISALTVDEALEQLDDDGGEVLVFENTANDRKTTVLYRREDGSYGLIEPAS